MGGYRSELARALDEESGRAYSIADQLNSLASSIERTYLREATVQQIFDAMLRAVNDLGSINRDRALKYAPDWIEGWVAALQRAGFTPSNPDAPEIVRALALLEKHENRPF